MAEEGGSRRSNGGVRVCVTGGAGFIGSWLVKKLLEKGYTMHATLRSIEDEKKAGLLRRLVPGEAPERLQLFEADLYDAATFAPAIAGCQFVFLIATPFQHDSACSKAIFVAPLNVTSEDYATNPGLNQVPASYFGVLKHQGDQCDSLLTSDLDSQSEQFVNSLLKTPMDGNIPIDVPARQNSLGQWKYLDDDNPCLGDNPSSAVHSFHPVTNKRLFNITEISPEWAYSIGNTKVLVVGYFHEQYKHLTESNMFGVFGDKCDATDTVQAGVYCFMAGPHTPGSLSSLTKKSLQ